VIRRLLRLLVAAGSGALLSAAYHPLDRGLLAWVAVAPLFALAGLHRGRGLLLESFVFGFVLFSLGCAWLYELTPIAGFVTAFLVALLFFVPFGLVLRTILADGRVPLLAAGPLVWLAFDWVRTWLLSGFPWLYLAHTQWSRPELMRISAWVGAYGLTFAMASVNAALAVVVLRLLDRDAPRVPRAWWTVPAAALLAVAVAALVGGAVVEGRPFRVAVVQGNIPQVLTPPGRSPSHRPSGAPLPTS
jgi:apolipoprotein N-acyltransferase